MAHGVYAGGAYFMRNFYGVFHADIRRGGKYIMEQKTFYD